MKEKNFVSAVIYVHNAQDRIEPFLQAVLTVLRENFEHSEIICVNDSSTDAGPEIIRRMARERGEGAVSVSLLTMSWFHGLEPSMKAGTDLSIGDFVFEFDNTCLNFNPEEIMRIYRRSLEGYDIVSASPDQKERFTSRLFYKVYNHYADVPGSMHTESFRILSRRVINRVGSMNRSVPYRKAAYAGCGLKTDNLRYPVVTAAVLSSAGGVDLRGQPETSESSPGSPGEGEDPAAKGCRRPSAGGVDRSSRPDRNERRYRSTLAVDSLILFTQIGYRVSMTMTVLMMMISVFMILYTVIIYVTQNPVAGWTTTILFLSVAFFGLFVILTIVIKYLQLLLDLIFRRHQYSFESIEKLV